MWDDFVVFVDRAGAILIVTCGLLSIVSGTVLLVLHTYNTISNLFTN